MLVLADCRFFVTKFNHFFCLIFKQRTKDITTNGYKKRIKKKKKFNHLSMGCLFDPQAKNHRNYNKWI